MGDVDRSNNRVFDGGDPVTTLHETAEYLRRMGEHEASVEYLLAHRAVEPSLLEVFGKALEPMVMPVRQDTGD